MICPKPLRVIHEEIQKKIFVMIPEKWDRLYLYASVIDHFNKLQTGEMFFYYYPKGVLKKKAVNVYEVPMKYNIDENAYYRMADDLYGSIKKLRAYDVENNEKAWTNLTISIEKLKYKVEYSYDNITTSEFDNNARHIIWAYKYLNTPYESLNREERKIIDKYVVAARNEPVKIFELPLYTRETSDKIDTMIKKERRPEFVTDEKIEEIKFKNSHIPKSQILNQK